MLPTRTTPSSGIGSKNALQVIFILETPFRGLCPGVLPKMLGCEAHVRLGVHDD